MQRTNSLSFEIPEPILLNCWKHHAGFIKAMVSEYKNHSESRAESFRKEILSIGGSIMDLYLGELTPAEIAGSITAFLKEMNVSGRQSYREWLGEAGRDFREIEIKDQSGWTLRLGEKEERYIHIHPSRYSPHTIRVRSTSLKSAIMFCILNRGETADTLTLINQIRREYLDLPPLKNMNSASAILKLVRRFS